VLTLCLCFQVYSPNPEEFNQDSARYPSPKPGGPPSLYSEYSYQGTIYFPILYPCSTWEGEGKTLGTSTCVSCTLLVSATKIGTTFQIFEDKFSLIFLSS